MGPTISSFEIDSKREAGNGQPPMLVNVNRHLKRKGGKLSELTAHCAQIKKIDSLLRSILPPPLKGHIKVANYTNGTLALHANSAVWRTRLHFQQAAILSSLRQEAGLQELRELQIKTRPPIPAYGLTADERPVPGTQRPRVGPECVRFLRDFARHGTQDPRIQRSLESIAAAIESAPPIRSSSED